MRFTHIAGMMSFSVVPGEWIGRNLNAAVYESKLPTVTCKCIQKPSAGIIPTTVIATILAFLV